MKLNLIEISGPLPTSYFEAVENDSVIGKLQLRHKPSKSENFPLGFENHIYYEINPEYQNKGYGKQILSLGLDEAKKAGLTEVILTCVQSNIASKKIIVANNGKLLDNQLEKNGEVIEKYKIAL